MSKIRLRIYFKNNRTKCHPDSILNDHTRRSVNCRGHKIFARKICIKNKLNARIYMILARKIIKIPEFL